MLCCPITDHQRMTIKIVFTVVMGITAFFREPVVIKQIYIITMYNIYNNNLNPLLISSERGC